MEKVGKLDANDLSEDFIDFTWEIRQYLTTVQRKSDAFDRHCGDREARIKFILKNQEKIFLRLTAHFKAVWQIVKDFDKGYFAVYSAYYQKELGELLLKAEVNKHIHDKPLGYSGDYVTMGHIYQYHDDFLGESSYEMLINHYTCNIPISGSNIKRKRYLKEQILSVLSGVGSPKIVSVGSGPAQELLDLLDEGKLNKRLDFYCVDFEPKALQYVKDEVAKRKPNGFLKLNYVQLDIKSLVKAKNIGEVLKDADFLYASGLFDYLSDRFAGRAVSMFFNLLKENGYMIIVNANIENSEMRAYYELLGTWTFHHRTREEMLEWVTELGDSAKVTFEEVYPPNNYLFMKMGR
jgi:SAM-dependent methyltransferase